MKQSTSVSFLGQANLPEKVVIIGGGIAGLSAYKALKRFFKDVQIYETKRAEATSGMGFLILENGFQTFQELGLCKAFSDLATSIPFFEEYEYGERRSTISCLDSVYSMRRDDLLSLFKREINPEHIHYNKKIASFIRDENARATAAVFDDGTIVEGDIFIGADGINSTVRKSLFPEANLQETDEHEIVFYINGGARDRELGDGFSKFICAEKGFNVGMFKLREDDIICFVQLDVTKDRFKDLSSINLKSFIDSVIEDLPKYFRDVFEGYDLDRRFYWKTKRMDLLPRFHSQNIVLIGDAAHPLLPFTSQGVNSALRDALSLSKVLVEKSLNLNDRFDLFYKERQAEIQHYIDEGDLLLDNFLNAKKQGIPLVC